MKRVLVVALLAFLAGFALLVWLDRSEDEVLVPLETSPETPPIGGGGETIAIPDSKGQVTQFESSGPMSVTDTYPDSGVRRYVLTARDHRSVGTGAVDAQNLEVLLYGADGLVLERALNAERGRVWLDFADGRPQLSAGEPATFEQVKVRFETGLEFAPMELEIPSVAVLFDTQKLDSEDQVVVIGRGLRATGRGLHADGLTGLMRLEHDPVVDLLLDDGSPAKLTAAGPLTFQNRPDLGPEVVEVLALGGATLSLGGDGPVEVQAQQVRLLGHLRDENNRFVPERVEAEGSVVVRPTEGRFLGNSGVVHFGPDGRPTHGELRGDPRAFVILDGVTFEDRKRVEDPQATLPVEARGNELLTLEFGASSKFQLEGPAEIALPSLSTTVKSQGPMRGGREAGGAYDAVTAEGGVTLTSPTESLQAERVDVEALPGQGGEVFARVTTYGSTRANGTIEEGGGTFELLATGGLVYTRHGDAFSVPRASGVELVVTGPDAFRASAAELRDLDGVAQTFEAEGDVQLENAAGRGTGERLVAHGPRHAEMFGVPAHPARFVVPEGELSAQRVELNGLRLFAEGDVQAAFELEGQSATLSARWLEIDEDLGEGSDLEDADWRMDAGGDVRARVVTADARHDLAADLLRLRANDAEETTRAPDELPRKLVPVGLEAVGNVVADYASDVVVHTEGQHLIVDRAGNAVLTPAAGSRVHLTADVAERGLRIDLDADSVEYGLERMVATRPDMTVDGLDLPVLGGEIEGDEPRLHAVAGRMALDRRSMLLSEGSYVARVSPLAQGWSLDADQILLTGDTSGVETPDAAPPAAEGLPLDGPFKELYAWGGFVASGSDALQARGERLAVSSIADRITITGSPATVVGNGVTWHSDWFELDGTTRSIRAAAGEMVTTRSGARGPWRVRYSSMEPIETTDTIIQVLREPVLTGTDEELRGAWALFWVDTRRWRQISGAPEDQSGATPETGERRAPARMNSLFGEIQALGKIDWLREFYMEGNVEYIVQGDSKARAEAIYLDLVDGHGWVRKADIETDIPFDGGRTPIKVRADWLRHSAGGAYHAENAVATTCSFEDPHYVIRVGHFGIRPRTKPKRGRPPAAPGSEEDFEVFDGWDIEARHNRLVVWRDFAIPLPTIGVPVSEEGNKYKVDPDQVSVFGMRPLSFGSDAKFGTFVGLSFAVDLGAPLRWIGRLLNYDLWGGGGGEGEEKGGGIQGGKGDLHVRWFNRRGLLLGVDVPVYDPGRFWLDTSVDGIFDSGEDSGLLRVPTDQRSLWRGWYHARGRYLLGEREWIDAVITYQSDPGFQAEFFEGEYQEFEERETYLHWRRANGDTFVAATVEAQLDDFHTEVMDRPAATLFDGRSRIASLGEVPVYYGSSSSLGHYERIEGEGGFEPPFPDGLGERDLSRFDTEHRIETPIDLGLAGLRATPYLDGRVTAWSEGADPDESPFRAGVLTGAELATTMLKVFEGGARHMFTPSIGLRTDIATTGDDIELVPLDITEAPLEGTFVDLGLRSRWTHSERRDSLDIAVVATHSQGSTAFPADGWVQFGTRGGWLSTMWGVPYTITYDLRYDPETGETDYSRTELGFEPLPTVDIELSHHFGRDPVTSVALFDAASMGARYYFSEKWQIEARQTISNQDGGTLASNLGVRRLGHDFVIEIDTRFVAGEGEGKSISFKLTPLLTWHQSGFSVLDRARREGY
jgi:hypothetical protein